jgi:steroid delta-isomerase-like uncharacterized protein
MSATNKTLARRFLEAFATADRVALEAIVAPDFVDHKPAPDQAPGREGLIGVVTRFRAALPDMAISIENVVAEGDLVAVNGLVTGTNRGPMMGAPATGKSVSFAYMDMYRVVNGRIAESWHVEDIVAMLSQLGMMPE